MGTAYTDHNIGSRKYIDGLGWRNFEPDQTLPVQYKVVRGNLEFLGTTYNAGDTLPYDATPPASVYTATAITILQRYWDQGWIEPVS